jgi:hypothetical protein
VHDLWQPDDDPPARVWLDRVPPNWRPLLLCAIGLVLLIALMLAIDWVGSDASAGNVPGG